MAFSVRRHTDVRRRAPGDRPRNGGSRTGHGGGNHHAPQLPLSYTLYLNEIDAGRSPNVAAPEFAKHYWNLHADATLRDVVLMVRADEAHHRDVNHEFSNRLAGEPADGVPTARYPQHADEARPDV